MKELYELEYISRDYRNKPEITVFQLATQILYLGNEKQAVQIFALRGDIFYVQSLHVKNEKEKEISNGSFCHSVDETKETINLYLDIKETK